MPFLRTFIGHELERDPDSAVRARPGLSIQARSLGEAVTTASEYFKVRIVPHDPPKWFRIYGWPGEPEEFYKLVDIHIRRGTESICPKQDLNYPPLDSDTVNIGTLAC